MQRFCKGFALFARFCKKRLRASSCGHRVKIHMHAHHRARLHVVDYLPSSKHIRAFFIARHALKRVHNVVSSRVHDVESARTQHLSEIICHDQIHGFFFYPRFCTLNSAVRASVTCVHHDSQNFVLLALNRAHDEGRTHAVRNQNGNQTARNRNFFYPLFPMRFDTHIVTKEIIFIQA